VFTVPRTVLAGLVAVLVVTPAAAQSTTAVRAAVVRALPLLQRSAARFVDQRACVSCHHNSLAVITLRLARTRGLDVDARTLDAVEAKTFRELRGPRALDDAIQGVGLADPTPNESYMLIAAHSAGITRDLTTEVYARRMARWQRDGHWVTSDFRPPHSSSLFAATASAVRTVQFYMPAELSSERDQVVSRARQWLIATRPVSTEDASFRLLGLAWAGATADDRTRATNDLIALQRSDGGFPQLAGYQSDAYSTGEALFALHEAGTPATDPRWQKGLRFLVSSQARDGSWHVRTRMISPATVSPPYFATGFPYGKDEFLSYAGSCWAVMAMLSALPEAPVNATPGPANTVDAPSASAEATARPRQSASREGGSWVRTALFGTARELSALLDGGLDPASKTEAGTTLLMMAAPDPEKVRMLIARGVDAKRRAASGTDALTIAAGYFGSAPSIASLLAAGADVQAPEGVRVRRSPLVLSAMTGDVETTRLLLSRGAEASSEALSEAVTFGHADVVRTLVDAGANVNITESSGVNLLHWAAITNRTAVIPVLARAGVALNAIDDKGFTPLMYAATVDVGDTATLKALLDAGADRRIRNDEGRTAFEQARHFRHPADCGRTQIVSADTGDVRREGRRAGLFETRPTVITPRTKSLRPTPIRRPSW
jgi:ankyrin repeat protein